MQAIRQHAFGGPQELRLETVPDPHPADGQVRIRVESAGVHLLDTVIRQGKAGGSLPLPKLPMTPGREVAGAIDQVAGDVDERLLGHRVVTDLGMASGGYAELALARVASLHVLPEKLDADQAVTMIGTGRTTMAILDVAAPTADDLVVVTAAAGGIGTLLVQAVGAAGATVVGVAGGRQKVSLVRELGAAAAIDYSQPGWPDAVRAALGQRPVTLALDGVGGEIGRAALELLGVGGRLVMFGTSSGTLTKLSAGDLYGRGITALAAIGARIVQRPGGLRDRQDSAAPLNPDLTPRRPRAGQASTATRSTPPKEATLMHPNPPGPARATARRLDPKHAPLLAPAIMAIAMSLVISLVQTIAKHGLAPNLLSAWLTSFAIGVVAAVPTAILVAPPVQRLVGQLTGTPRHLPPQDRR